MLSFKTSLNLSRTRFKMQQYIRILKQKYNAAMIALGPMSLPSSVKLGSRNPEKASKLCQL